MSRSLGMSWLSALASSQRISRSSALYVCVDDWHFHFIVLAIVICRIVFGSCHSTESFHPPSRLNITSFCLKDITMTPWLNRVTALTKRMADDMHLRNKAQATIGRTADCRCQLPLGERLVAAVDCCSLADLGG